MDTTGSTTSSNTSTSHTMTALPKDTLSSTNHANTANSPVADLLTALAPQNRHTFVQPPASLPNASLQYVKITLDGFAGPLGDEQLARQKEDRKKRKRGESGLSDGEVLKIRKVHVQGFEVEQVWEQARRVIDALRGDAERVLEEFGPVEEESEEDMEGESGVELLNFDEDGFEVSSGDDGESDDGENDDEKGEEEDSEDADLEAALDGEGADDFDGLDDDEDEDEDEEEEDEEEEPAGTFTEDPHGLNDGFFSIDDFNKQTEFLEQQDAAADPYTGEASDEEDVDWDVDPMTMTMTEKPTKKAGRAAAMDVDDEEEEDDEEGPTFGNMDLNAPEGESDEDEDGDADMDEDVDAAGDNTNEVLYKDFFEPPPRKAGKAERQANYLERQARKSKAAEPEDEGADMERAMADVRRDLFEDESEGEDSQDALSDVDPADPKSRRSAHERRQAKLAEEIRRLEAASVQKREWTLSGEARAADRPLNSLLEEDLDFERTGKPVPVITAEVSESIEELIKRRILAQEFDEVVRRRPDALNNPGNARRGQFELDDSKPQQSLAEMYEEEHVKNNNPDTYISKSDEKEQKEEREIEGLWKEVSAKLDALSSWHYKPKPAAPTLTVVSDVATIAMEDAQPSTAAGMAGAESMLAPQEIYKTGKDKETVEKGEVVPKSGVPVARQEMTREEKLRRRRREKERIRKRGGEELNQRQVGKKEQAKRDTLGELKKGGVKVIGKKGEVRDVEGNKIKDSAALNGAGGFKL
ncbi:putative U3 small nucleolar ribonucleo protein mpp10 [Coleophoma crateriformis]|uniref:U3 small nucleolar ribonucleoprotein protein MPP10 n=1 Tax=Coleophoma crateriformis TaxID=565419 RepID=A0A3D8SYC3_9HELO|nr:putative U3 small nucleolar ribonucleo protein mpp10 [Coleophoma crateriformis]